RGAAGAMLAVKAAEGDILRVLSEEKLELVLANRNAPRQTVLSGPTPLIERAAAAFTARKIGNVRLGVAAALHSPMGAAAREPVHAALAAVSFPAGGAVYANSTAQPYPDAAGAARDLLAGQLARPVLWVQQVEAMYAAGVRSFLEVGQGARISGNIEATLEGR